jgi:hypothetical protein
MWRGLQLKIRGSGYEVAAHTTKESAGPRNGIAQCCGATTSKSHSLILRVENHTKPGLATGNGASPSPLYSGGWNFLKFPTSASALTDLGTL